MYGEPTEDTNSSWYPHGLTQVKHKGYVTAIISKTKKIGLSRQRSDFTIFRPRKSAKRPLVTAPTIAPIVSTDPKIANCRLRCIDSLNSVGVIDIYFSYTGIEHLSTIED